MKVKNLEDPGTKTQDATHGFQCECGFMSTGHATKSARDERKRQHLQEHESGEPMMELAEFWKGEH